MTFTLTVTYGDAPPVSVSAFEQLSTEQAEQGLGAFLRDMLRLEGSAVTKITIERISP